MLKPGGVTESITVQESPVAVQFNSTNVSLTIDTKLANEIPRFDRNPFKLSLLNPAVVNTRTEMMPYHSWTANSGSGPQRQRRDQRDDEAGHE